jgi:uncharacterized membrane-anchored protein
MSGATRHARLLVGIAVALPALGIALGIARSELHYARSQEWALPVAGYDPRDLLRGHYLLYRLDLPTDAPGHCPDDNLNCCLCLSRGEPLGISRQQCDAAASCEGLLRSEYLPELQRFYVPESRAQEAEEKLRAIANRGKAKLVIALDPNGKPQVKALLIDGKPLLP